MMVQLYRKTRVRCRELTGVTLSGWVVPLVCRVFMHYLAMEYLTNPVKVVGQMRKYARKGWFVKKGEEP